MRERPAHLDEGDLLAEVRRLWQLGVDRVGYLPVGFGAHHWAAYDGDRPRWFVTYDEPGDPQARADLEAAYAGANALQDAGLAFVHAPHPTASGRFTARYDVGELSGTPWLDGTSEESLDLGWTIDVLQRLHATAPPAGLPAWRPKVGAAFAEATARLTDRAWGPGPYAEPARTAVRRRVDDVARWTDRYHHLGRLARERPWVACHGEPHEGNQVRTASGRYLVDWDTLRLAPAELDLRVLVEHGADPDQVGADPELLELFDLEWRLDEISQYADWFAAPHGDTADDRIAFDDLLHELARP